MATREKGRKKTKPEAPQEASQQFTVTDPISMADLENIHTRRGKYPSHPPPLRPKTWELARKEKEERVLKERRARPLSTPLGTTSTDAMDGNLKNKNMSSISKICKFLNIKFQNQSLFLCQI